MKKILIAIIILSFSLSPIRAEDYSTAHTFSSGGVISADMMNEIFDIIENVTKVITASSILGTWSCSVATTAASGSCGNYNSTDNLFYETSGTITFSDDGDGTYTYETGDLNFLRCKNNTTSSSYKFEIKNGILFTLIRSDLNGGSEAQFRLNRISNTKFLMESQEPNNLNRWMFFECDKQATPPSNPTAFAITTTNLSNVLTWTDNSSDETGFKVYKKTSVTGSWSLIDAGASLTVISDVTTYTDTVTEAGDYWYRVKANNITNGDSVGSNVIKTTNTD